MDRNGYIPTLVPFILDLSDAGDKEAFNFQLSWKTMGTMFRAHSLMRIGQAFSCLCKTPLMGYKHNKEPGDMSWEAHGSHPIICSSCSITGNLLLQNPAGMNAQSRRNLCFLLQIIMGKDPRKTIKEFRPMLQLMEDCKSDDPMNDPMALNWGMGWTPGILPDPHPGSRIGCTCKKHGDILRR